MTKLKGLLLILEFLQEILSVAVSAGPSCTIGCCSFQDSQVPAGPFGKGWCGFLTFYVTLHLPGHAVHHHQAVVGYRQDPSVGKGWQV